jgi:hypothetical protein
VQVAQIVIGPGVQVEGVCAQPQLAPWPREDGGAGGIPEALFGTRVFVGISGDNSLQTPNPHFKKKYVWY